MVALVRYDAACRALADATAIDEAKEIRDLSIAMRAYARQAKNKDLEADAWTIRQRAERRIHELVEAQRHTVGLAKGGQPYQSTGSRLDPVEVAPSLKEAGIDKHLADRTRKLGKLDNDEFERRLAEGRARIQDASERVRVDLIAPVAHVGQNSGDNEWYTPAEWIEPARKVLGGIDLDPASSAEANKVIKAKRFYTADDDGLSVKWEGRVWMNPPYAQPAIEHFSEKLASDFERKGITAAIALVNNATETAWFQRLASAATAVCFPSGRIRFWHPDKTTAAPLQGQALLYLGAKSVNFHNVFADLGIVWVKP